jgi:hypothetical protein
VLQLYSITRRTSNGIATVPIAIRGGARFQEAK